MRLFGFEITRTKAQTLEAVHDRGWFSIIKEPFAGAWQRGYVINAKDTLLAFAAVYACVSLIAGDIAKLRPRILRRQENGIWREEEEKDSSYTVLRKPNGYQTALQFVQEWLTRKLTWGNTYVLKRRGADKKVREMYVLDSSRVRPYVAPSGEVFYGIGPDNLSGIQPDTPLIPASEIIHDRGPCLFHPLLGVPPLFACAASTTQGTRIQANSLKFFENMSRPSGHLGAPGKIDDKDLERLKKAFEENFAGDNIGRLLITGSDIKYTPMAMPAEQAQLIEQLKFTVEDVARAHGVPLYKIAAGQAPAQMNVAALNLEYYQQALQPHIEGIEQLLDQGLALGNDLMVEFDLDGLLRMDPKTRAETDEIELRAAIQKPNEARARRNLTPVDGGDTPYLQQQNYSLAALAKRDAQDDPFKTGGTTPPRLPKPANEEEEISDEEGRAAVEVFSKELACT